MNTPCSGPFKPWHPRLTRDRSTVCRCVSICPNFLSLMLLAVLLLQERAPAQVPEIRAAGQNRAATQPLSGRTVRAESTAPVPATGDLWYRIEYDSKPAGYERVTTVIENPSGAAESGPVRRTAPLGTVSASRTASVALRDAGIRVRRRETRLLLKKRSGVDDSVSAHLETRETTDGRLLSWSIRRTAADGTQLERAGTWRADESAYEVTERVQATRRTYRLNCVEQPRSPLLSGWLPVRMDAGERRFRTGVLFPETASIAEIDVAADGQQSLKRFEGGTAVTSRIQYWPVGNAAERVLLFVDDQGIVVRSEQMLRGGVLSMVLTDAAAATGSGSLESLDAELQAVLPVKHSITSAARRAQTRLRLTTSGSIQPDLPASEFQQLETGQGNQTIVTLLRTRELSRDERYRRTSGTPVDSQYLQETHWLTVKDQGIERAFRSAVGGATAPDEVSRRLTQYVASHIRQAPFSTALVPAAETIRHGRGDSTEQAVLLAALMRYGRIPSRVVVGLVYSERAGGFVAHMWVEAWIADVWRPFDPAASTPQLPAIYLKVAESSLDDQVASGTLLFLPLLDLIGQVEIDVLPDTGIRTME